MNCQRRLTGLTGVVLTILLVCSGLPGCNGRTSTVTPVPGENLEGLKAVGSASGMQFSEVTAESGVDFSYENGEDADQYTILESLGGGVAVIDFDLDGLPDLFFTGGGGFAGKQITGKPPALFRNTADLQFTNVSQQAAGGFQDDQYSHGAWAADYDNDGFVDLLVTGYGGLQLWRNQGDGTYAEVGSSAALDDKLWSSAAAWSDFDGDGNLDLYVAHYVDWSFANHPFCPSLQPNQRDICPPREFAPLPDLLYLSNGDGTFRGLQSEAGLRRDGKGLGVLVFDADQDNDADIYVGNDTTDNFLYVNDGAGRFEEKGMERGTAVDNTGIPNGSMGLDICDFNNDGQLDLWVANYEREDFALYRNEGAGNFLHISRLAGLTALGGLYVGFGTACADFDGDGDEDIVVSNGHVIRFPMASPRKQIPLLLANLQQRFSRVEVTLPGYFTNPHEGRGLATGDLDGDGDLDLAISHLNEPVAVLRNDAGTPSQWLQVQLIGTASNRDAIGATLILQTSDGSQMRHFKGGGSYLSTSQRIAFWGLKRRTIIEKLTIRWPSGKSTVIDSVVSNQRLTVAEPAQ